MVEKASVTTIMLFIFVIRTGRGFMDGQWSENNMGL